MAQKVGFNSITKHEAEVRASSIRTGVQYDCFFKFDKGETYEGIMQVIFQLTDLENIFLDYSGVGIKEVVVNGIVCENPAKLF